MPTHTKLPENDAETTWTSVDAYFTDALLGDDPVLRAVLQANEAAGLPAIDVSAAQGRMLTILAMATGAKRVLELGTLGGYSTICLAHGVQTRPDAHVVTLEFSDHHARVARSNFDRAGLGKLIDLRVGKATDGLDALIAARTEPFDLIFIDADKVNYPVYLAKCLKLSRPGTLIVADNVVRDGKVIHAASSDANVQAVRQLTELVAKSPNLTATTIQTVGVKGYDGFMLISVR